mmetsp:Transcript_27203/g.59413  ORF Transcript_27203/g.59413 Transcript_27203/m.59413 type:complete len:877 (-) Transcript_27203:705-3335(-)
MAEDNSETRIQLKRSFADFLERDFEMPDDPTWNYGKGLRELYTIDDEGKATKLVSRRLMVHEHHLREFDESLLQRLLQHPAEALPAFEDALKEFVKSGVDPTLLKLLETRDELHVGLKGDFGRYEVSPRELTAQRLNQLVCVFGIVTKCSLVRPKVVKSVHYCEATKAFTSREYRDVTALSGLPTGAQYPQKDDHGNLLTTEYGLCQYKDSQMIAVQELPETAPAGQLPHSAEIVLEDDLVDKVKPGDRVSIVGVYKTLAGKASGQTSGVFKAVVVGVSIQKLTKENQVKHTVEEARHIRRLAEQPTVLQTLANSLAPSIYGHEIIKRGLVLLMFGGLEKNLENGTHLRGDINCLLVGDPGVAKSQMLRACMNIAPHAVSTTGRGSSGVGLTAAVTTDNETGEKRLEAGAMVLADRGIVCIDEFDKMSDQDRVAIHEVMEQQTVTIAKAGIHTSLNARCSVLAAANPLYGSYDKAISVMRNVNLPDSLLSRFDMLFVVLDQMDDQKDRQMAMHVIKQHRYRPAGEDGKGAPVQETIHDRRLSIEPEGGAFNPYMKHDSRLHATSANGAPVEVLNADFLRKYIIFARRRYAKEGVKIGIEDEAAEKIIEYYTHLRSKSHQERALPVTARTLETIIRLATASCKVRLRFTIDARDVEVATHILDHVMKKDVGSVEEEEEAGEEEQQAEDNAREEPERRNRKRGRRGRGDEAGGSAPGGNDDDDNDGGDGDAPDAPAQGMDVDSGAGAAEAGPSTAAGRSAAARSKRQATDSAMQALGLATGAAASRHSQVVSEREGLTDEQKAVVISAIQECIDEITDDHVPLDELQTRLRDRNLRVPDKVLVSFLTFIHQNYDKAEWKGRMPQIMWDDGLNGFMSVA